MAEYPARTRLLGTALLLAGVFGGPIAVGYLADSWYRRLLAAVLAGEVLVVGIHRRHQHVRLLAERLEVVGSWRTHLIPWGRLHGVRRDGATLAVAWEPDLMTAVGPFDAPPGLTRQQHAELLGAQMLALRERAVVGDGALPEATHRPGPAWVYLIGYAALVAASFWWTALR